MSTSATSSGPASLPAPAAFREAVKYVLVHDHGMPELVAEEVLNGDAAFLERKRVLFLTEENAVTLTADALVMPGRENATWVRLEPGQTAQDSQQLILDPGPALACYLDRIVALGLFGSDRHAVALALLARGIEAVVPLLASTGQSREEGRVKGRA